MREQNRQAVLRAVESLGYAPNQIARQLRSSRTHVIAVIVDDVIHSMDGYAVHGAEDAAKRRGYSAIVGESRGNPDLELELVQNMLARRVEGIICMPRRSRGVLKASVEPSGIPIVFFGQLNERAGTHSAVIDETNATHEAVGHLVGEGHRSFVLTSTGGPVLGHRLAALRASIDRLTFGDGEISLASGDIEVLHEAVRDAMTVDHPPTAVICLTHRHVPRALLGVKQAGLRVPRDASLVAFGDSEWAVGVTPSINVIAANFQGHVEQATERLINLIERSGAGLAAIVDTSLYIRRESVGPRSPRR